MNWGVFFYYFTYCTFYGRNNCRELLSIIKVNGTKQQTYRLSFSLRNNRMADHFQVLRQNLSVHVNYQLVQIKLIHLDLGILLNHRQHMTIIILRVIMCNKTMLLQVIISINRFHITYKLAIKILSLLKLLYKCKDKYQSDTNCESFNGFFEMSAMFTLHLICYPSLICNLKHEIFYFY